LPKLTFLFVRPLVFLLISLLTSPKLDRHALPWIAGLKIDSDDDYELAEECALRVGEILAATTHIGMIRERAMVICVALQDLELPAFVTLQIIDEAVYENSIRMWAKWELITAVKHFHGRRFRE
jgi:hypothetical protein